MNISVIVTTFNGERLLKSYLPSVLKACENYSFDKTELIVVDDAGNDGTRDYLRSAYPFIKVIGHDVNKGFPATANDGVFAARNKIAVLLNNDVRVSGDFLLCLPRYFEDKDVFAARPGLTGSPDGHPAQNRKIGGRFRAGFFDVPRETKEDRKFAFFSGGGASAYDREKFLELGGFDEIFAPFYFEDVDLSYRAWKRGWRTVYAPECLAFHQGGGTIPEFHEREYITVTAERNKYFLVWKNITDKRLLFQHFIFIPARIIGSLIKGRSAPLAGFINAFKKINAVMAKRKLEKRFVKMKDREIFGLFRDY